MSEQSKSCGACAYFTPDSQEHSAGRCQRYPRQRTALLSFDQAGAPRFIEDCNFPLALATEFCGEFAMKPQGNA